MLKGRENEGWLRAEATHKLKESLAGVPSSEVNWWRGKKNTKREEMQEKRFFKKREYPEGTNEKGETK